VVKYDESARTFLVCLKIRRVRPIALCM